MDEKGIVVDDEDDDVLVTRMPTAAPSHHRKVQSYSQPLTAAAAPISRRSILHHSSDPTSNPSHHHSLSGGGDGFTLEQAMSEYGGTSGNLNEFTGAGGGSGVFRVPVRSAVHPSRPPSLELRPHPLRETQVGTFLRSIAASPSHLWAATEAGIRCYSLADAYLSFAPGDPCSKPGDEESAPFRESFWTSPTLCLAVDNAHGLVWSGHKDGKIRSWKIEEDAPSNSAADDNSAAARSGCGGGGGSIPFKEGLSWQAHKGRITCIVITSYGELWSGSEGGSIKAWPWETIDKSLSLTIDKRHMAALLVERSYVDLRGKVTVNGVCPLPAVDIKYLLSDSSKSKVWSASSLSFALWDARTKELLKVFNIDGQIDTRLDSSSAQDPSMEDEPKVKFVSSSKKEKPQGSISFLQRSRNALMGAADVVRRVASKGTFGEDNRRTEALAMAMDGMIWTGCTNGSLVQWDGNGNRVQEVQHHLYSVRCIHAFGTRLWVGYVSGTVHIMDLEGQLIGGWLAHSNPVIKIAVGGFYLFTLANHGGIRGWNLTSPGPIDNILRAELSSKELVYMKMEKLKILVGTWNVGQEKASHDSLISWVGAAASGVGLVVVGLQEVEMGAGSLAMAAAKETVGLEGSAVGQWWLDTIGKTLDEGTSFERVGSRQLAGMLISAWARKNLRPHIGDVDAAAVPCGFGRAIGNKGAVGLRMRIYDRRVCFISCHFAAHLEAVSRRNADFDHVFRTCAFSRPSIVNTSGSAGASSTIQSRRGGNAAIPNSDDGKPELSEADMIVFLGDFNYRLYGISYDEARDMVSQRCFDWLREKDQLRAEMKAGRVFQGMREGQIKFPPTYKFERHTVGLAGYDSSEKKRIPAWCDRILYRDSRSISLAECSLECPVVSSISQYEACMDVNDSDHKPVRCIFSVEIAFVDELIRRKEFGEIMQTNEKIRSILEESFYIPDVIVSTSNIILQNQDNYILRITNKCEKSEATFQIICKGQSTTKDDGSKSDLFPRGSFGFPQWLQVFPAAGIIKCGEIIEVTMHHDSFYTQEEFVDGAPQNWWCEDTKDKEAMLTINVMGSYSTEIRSYDIHVRHCFQAKFSRSEAKGYSRRPPQSNHLQRSDPFSNSDVMRDLCHTPS